MVKHLFVLSGLMLIFISGSLAQEPTKGGLSYGILYMAGGRYDDVRMCVASAAGPFISWQFGLEFRGHQKTRGVGIRAFYIPLTAKDHSDGTVLGGALEYTFYF